MKKQHLLLILFLGSLYSCSFNGMFLQPTKVPNGILSMNSKAEDGSKMTIQFSKTDYQPTFIKNNNDTLDFEYSIESIVFKSKNGNKLNGWLLKPKNQKIKNTIIHFHGNAGFLVNQYKFMTPFTTKGFQIFLFDYSGFGFSEGEAARKNVLIDAISAVNYVKNRPELTKTKLIIYGQSLGGHLSAVVASKMENEIDALVIEGAFSSHDDIAAETAGFLGRILVDEKYSAKQYIKTFKKPVLIIHSKDDKTIPIKLGRKLFENANQPKEFYEITGCHICGPLYFSDSIAKKINKMIN
jgi:hypothetical protein